MKNQKWSKRAQILLSAGLLIQSFPFLFQEFFGLNDFCSGFLHGLGIMLILGALFIGKNNKRKIYRADW